MADFGLIRPFGIDGEELDDISRQECFVLGYELALVDEAIKKGEPIQMTVHAFNADRIKHACHQAGRNWKLAWCGEDSSEAWMELYVQGRPVTNEEG